MTTSAPPAARPRPTSASFRAIGTRHQVLVTEPRSLLDAAATTQEHLAELDQAVSRFRADSEVSRLAEMARRGAATMTVSPMFAAYLEAAIRAARLSGGLVDPTVGAAVAASGYDADLDLVRGRRLTLGLRAEVLVRVPGWRSLAFDAATRRLTVPIGTVVDLGATAKAHAADTVAAMLGARFAGGFLVNLGGDIAVGGELPEGGWRVGVEGVDGQVRQVVLLGPGQAIATSSTQRRTWIGPSGEQRHHIVDPRTGRTAVATWATVTCIGVSALEANTAATAAVVLGEAAPTWLGERGIPARLERLDGRATRTPGWPAPRQDRS